MCSIGSFLDKELEMKENLLEAGKEMSKQQNESIELSTSSLEERDKVTTSLEDIYGYKVLTETFQKKIDAYNAAKDEENQQCLQYVFTQEPKDEVGLAFKTVMHAETNTIIIREYEDKIVKQDNVFIMIGFGILGAVITGLIWVFIENRRKEKQKNENCSDYENIIYESKY